jgi:hypothetical protein
MRRCVVESPFAGDIVGNLAYARACLRDCLMRGEAPIASHLLFTQDGIFRDDIPAEREIGINAGHARHEGGHAGRAIARHPRRIPFAARMAC